MKSATKSLSLSVLCFNFDAGRMRGDLLIKISEMVKYKKTAEQNPIRKAKKFGARSDVLLKMGSNFFVQTPQHFFYLKMV